MGVADLALGIIIGDHPVRHREMVEHGLPSERELVLVFLKVIHNNSDLCFINEVDGKLQGRIVFVTWARVVCLICTPKARRPQRPRNGYRTRLHHITRHCHCSCN